MPNYRDPYRPFDSIEVYEREMRKPAPQSEFRDRLLDEDSRAMQGVDTTVGVNMSRPSIARGDLDRGYKRLGNL